ncbi:MAG: ATP-binding protein [Pigmentiphaga sp.]|nr:ATP-binding protein [Pigmentiphaga sp.]
MAEHAPCVLWSAAADGSWTYVNPAWTRLTGQPAGKAAGWGWLDRVPDNQRERVRAAFTKGAAAAAAFDIVHGLLGQEDALLNVHTQAHPSFQSNQQFVGFSGTCLQYQEPATGVAAEGGDEGAVRRMLDLVPDAFMAFDPSIRYVYANAAAGRLFGIEPETFAGKTARELGLTPYIASVYEQSVADAFATGKMQTVNYRIDTGADTRHFRVRATPDPDASRVLAVTTDVTAWVLAQVELDTLLLREQAARAQAESAAGVRDQFLSVVSHELRSPLNGIQSWAHVLESRVDASIPGVTRALAGIKTGVQQQVRLIDELLDVTHAMTGRLQLEMELLSLEPVVRRSLAKAEQSASERGLTLRAQWPGDDIQVRACAERLEQMVDHLLSNAIKFGAAGGEVSVRIEAVGSEACIAVGDTGKGIAPDVMPYLFDPFRQLDTFRSRRSEGLGVGLTLVRHLAELHGGRVAAHSGGEGQGAVFSIYLPLAAGKPAAEPERTGQVPADALADIRILLVENHAQARGALADSLRQAGAAVTACETGAAALEHLQQADQCALPQVVISNVTMPGLGGCDLLARIRELERSAPHRFPAPTPTIALTAAGQREDRIRALASGFQVYMVKPVEFSQLVGLIQSLARTATVERR